MTRINNEFEKLKFLYIDKIRIANPSEWQGLTEDNFRVYASFLAGELCIGKGESFPEAKRNKIPVIDFKDDETDFLSTEELVRLMKWKKVIFEKKFELTEFEA